jgi:hypothetical protein
MQNMPFRVYMGYDSHEDITFEVKPPSGPIPRASRRWLEPPIVAGGSQTAQGKAVRLTCSTAGGELPTVRGRG